MTLRQFLVWIFLAPSCAFGVDKPTLLDGTAATVGKIMFTVQDAHYFLAVQRLKDGDPDLRKNAEGEELRKGVQKLIFEEMVMNELTSFKFEGGTRGEADKLVRGRREKLKPASWSSFLAAFAKTDAQVVDAVWKSTRVERFIQNKIETLTPLVTQAEVERYYGQNKARFGTEDYEKAKPEIVLILKRERMQKGLEEWVRFLRDKYGVTNHLAG